MNWSKKANATWDIGLFMLAGIFLVQISQQSIVANHGKEIDLKFSDAQFFSLPDEDVQQVKFNTTYSVSDPDTVGKQISGNMKIYIQKMES